MSTLVRTQEVAGSSPASSIARCRSDNGNAAYERLLLFRSLDEDGVHTQPCVTARSELPMDVGAALDEDTDTGDHRDEPLLPGLSGPALGTVHFAGGRSRRRAS